MSPRQVPAPPRSSAPPLALVVLGCALRPGASSPGGGGGRLRGALRRRVARAAAEWERASREDAEAERPRVIIATGGRSWGGEVEADAMAEELVRLGVPAGSVVRERASLTTRDNARFTAASCARRQIGRVAIVTCGWHLPRAAMCFEAEGLEVARLVSAGDGSAGPGARAWLGVKERFLRMLSAR